MSHVIRFEVYSKENFQAIEVLQKNNKKVNQGIKEDINFEFKQKYKESG